MGRIFLKFFYYLSRIIMFFYISLKVMLYGIFHPHVIFNFLFGVVTEIAEFHKRCGGVVKNFNETDIFKKITKDLTLSKSNCFNIGFGNIRPMEAQVMASLIEFLKPKTIFEIGTYNGFSTLHLAINAPENTIVYTLDLPQDRSNVSLKNDLVEAHKDLKNIEANRFRYFHQFPSKQKIVELFGDSMNFDFSPYYKKIDFVFIDANHSYAYVKADTENAFRMLSAKGVILWHDFDFIHPGVYQYIKSLALQKRIYFIERTRYAIFFNE